MNIAVTINCEHCGSDLGQVGFFTKAVRTTVYRVVDGRLTPDGSNDRESAHCGKCAGQLRPDVVELAREFSRI